MLGVQVRQKGLGLSIEIDSGVPAALHGDAGRIRQAVTNLVSNAVKFTVGGRVLARVKALGAGEGGGTVVRVEVTDTGIGIDPQILGRMFGPFSQADPSTTRDYGGTGLGLAISRQLVELMGGRIAAESELGGGSTFWFELELSAGRDAPAAAGDWNGAAVSSGANGRVVKTVALEGAASAAATAAAAAPPRSGGRPQDDAPLVLIADDSLVNQTVAQRMVERCGYRAELVADGRQAVDALKRNGYAAVLMDCQMPEMDGYQATVELRRRERGTSAHTPVIAMTANAMRGDRERCLAAGMDAYLSKPLRREVLDETLRRWIAAVPAVCALAGSQSAGGAIVLDEEALAELRGLPRQVFADLVSLYAEEAAVQISELREAFVAGDTSHVARAAHKLKGASLTVGAALVAGQARELETRAKAADCGGEDGVCGRLEDAVCATTTAYQNELDALVV